ncbi:hypothetical protein [Tropicimonas marinistellae]|uniref:hypothetical protein n=1 Tax=Tropicimonas marinistellae TaxID=1739787 RepID=UPI00122DD8E3|nr:hypothetical protein [Tropicimonas marinistellae]
MDKYIQICDDRTLFKWGSEMSNKANQGVAQANSSHPMTRRQFLKSSNRAFAVAATSSLVVAASLKADPASAYSDFWHNVKCLFGGCKPDPSDVPTTGGIRG